MNNFYNNLKKFHPYEREAAARIERLNKVKVINYCNDNKYDFLTNDNIKYEVKTEPASLKTNNFFIEFKGYGKPSGISTTEANYYIISDTINYYLISVYKLKLLVENSRIISTKDKFTFGYLIKKQIIKDNSFILISGYHI